MSVRLGEVLAGDFLTLVASVLYVVATVRDTARPEIVSWASWAALLTESTVAAFITGQYPSALYTGLCAAACAVVTVLSLRRGTWAVSALDVASMAAVAAGLVLLLVVRSPGAVVLVSVTADLAAYLPTMRHAWREPGEEPALTYLLFAMGAALTLAAESLVLTGIVYPLYLAVADSLMVVIIMGRRRAERLRSRPPGTLRRRHNGDRDYRAHDHRYSSGREDDPRRARGVHR